MERSLVRAGLPRASLQRVDCAVHMNARRRSAPRGGTGTVAVVVLASADDLLLNDVVAIPVLATVGHGHRGIATAVSLLYEPRYPC